MTKNIWFYSGDITNSGGTEKVATIIANELNKRDDFNVSFLSLFEKKETPYFKISDDIKRYTIYPNKVRGITHILGIIYRTRQLLKKNNVDILIDIDGILEMYTIPASRFLHTKIVSWEHYNYYQNPMVPYRNYTRKMAAAWADAIVTLTDEDKEYYLKNLNIKCPINYIYNPVIWKENEKGYNEESKIILSAGRLTYQKGFDILIDVADRFIKKYPDWTWIILGEGEDRKTLEQKIYDKKLDRQILMPGNADNIEKYYSGAAMFVMTSRFEGLPMTLLETKSFQLPLVSFECKTGPGELIEDGINGFLIPENDCIRMAKKIEMLINDAELRKRFSDKAKNNMERFELDLVIEKWTNLLTGL